MIFTDIKTINTTLKQLRENKTLDSNKFKSLLEGVHSLLHEESTNEKYNIALSAICHVAEYLPNDKLIQDLLHECIVASRVFLYHEMLTQKKPALVETLQHSIFELYARAVYTLDTNTVLTKEQLNLFETFQEKRKIVVSAPTSFGKSRIIQEIISHNNSYKNIAIVLPTIALLNETFNKFKQNPNIIGYEIVNSINNFQPGKKSIFILTPEKMDLLLDQHPHLKVDFFTMDEIYKIQDDPERRRIFTHCLYRLSKHKADYYLIGPYFENFSKKFLDATGGTFLKYTGEIVQKDTFDLNKTDYNETYTINGKTFKKLKNKDKNLINTLSALKEQTLIYIGTKSSVETRAKKIADTRDNLIQSDLIAYISDNIDKDWSLVKCLEKGVAFHHAGIPKYIQSEIVDSFNNNIFDIIVCTSTLTEGVNTSAKNVVIYDNTKAGTIPLTGFDIKNIKGRAGRFYNHFIGNVFLLTEVTAERDKTNIDFNYYDNKDLESEEVIQIEKKELSDQNLKLRNNIEEQLKNEMIPFALIKGNKFIPIQNQILLIKHLRAINLDKLFVKTSLPTKEELQAILLLCHEYLFNKTDKENKNYYIWELIKQTKYYLYKTPSIKALIKNQKGAKSDTRIRNTFTLITHFFEFALPKYLTAYENIFNYVWQEKKGTSDAISLKYLITYLEFGFINNHEIAMKEAGLPNDIIRKISQNFDDCATLDAIKLKFRLNPYLINNLSSFEQKIFKKYI